MSVSFDTQITSRDLYRYNLRASYTSAQGIISILLGVLILVIVTVSEDMHQASVAFPYIVVALIFLLYIPLSLFLRARNQIRMNEVFQKPLHFTLTDEGVVVASEVAEAPETLAWEYVYKASTTKEYLYIYSSRVNAFIIPKAQVADKLDAIYDALEEKLPDYKLRIKR